jgi:gamma-glutamyltranspeptidase/glutathione hydrolase
MRLVRTLASVVALVALTACGVTSGPRPLPRGDGVSTRAPSATGGEMLVAAANPLAAEAGMTVLRRGGSAVDAAVAVQAVLSLVEPQSSGIGGGAFMVHYDAEAKAVTAYDGRETAPAGATPGMFLDEAGKPLSYAQAVVSGRATGVPGVIAMLGQAQADHGRLPWRDLFGEAARLAEEGFVVSPRLATFANGRFPQASQPDAKAYFAEADGTPVDVGDVLKNPAYARTLRALAAGGPRSFYEGPLAAEIAARVSQAPLPGSLTIADMGAYRSKRTDALCTAWRVYRVCAPPPPSSGVSLLQALEILERTDIAARSAADPQAWFLLLEAQKLMYADRDQYVADPAFVPVPVAGLLDEAYVASRAALIGERAGAYVAGSPPGAQARAPDRTREPVGTSHFVVVDRWGDAVSVTTTVESIFGTGRMVGGFFLNNQLTDFSFTPTTAEGAPVANAVAPGKRPRSSMSPTVVTDRQGRLVAAIGSPGGSAILGYNLKTHVGVFDWGLPMQGAIDLPNIIARGRGVTGEAAKLAPGVPEALAARGVPIDASRDEISGLHGVIVRPTGLEGGADPRREGVVLVERP